MISATLILGLLFPGLLFCCLLRWAERRLILAIPLSIGLIVVVSLICQLTNISRFTLEAYLLTVFLLCLLTLTNTKARKLLWESCKQITSVVPIACGLIAYLVYAGAFTDFGVDVYQHMVFLQEGVRFSEDHNGALKFAWVPGTTNYLFHNIGVILVTRLDIPATELIEIYAIAFSLLWTITIFYFSSYLLKVMLPEAQSYSVLASLAVVLFWLTFGINNFSFPRYYIGGPVILNFGVFLAMVVLLIDMLRSSFTWQRVLMLGFLGLVGLILHPQEVFLFISFALGLSGALFVCRCISGSKTADIPLNNRNLMLSGLFAVAMVVGLYLSIRTFPRYAHDPISLHNLGWISQSFAGLNILRPTHQFYTVLGLWGLYIYFLAAFFWKISKNQVVVIAVLLIPLLTVFNPVFTEGYMRLAYPQVLWRLLFAMPLPVLAVYFLASVQQDWSKYASGRKWLLTFVFLPVLFLLFPFKNDVINNSMVRMPSMIPTPVENSYRHWEDLVEFLQNLPKKEKVLTDPVTGYAIRSLTRHFHAGYKFYPKNFINFANFASYEAHPLKSYSGWLIIINQRDGLLNERLSRPHHIYPDVTIVTRYYPESFKKEVVGNKGRYSLLWERGRIAVYRVL